MTRNPYSNLPVRISLSREDVDGFVFWTRNLGPFFPALEEVRGAGLPFVVQYTITGYPRELESSVVPPEQSIENIRRAAELFGPRTCVWRYDTILFSSLTPLDFHRRNFEALAHRLEGTTDEVVISFAQIYRKTKKNLEAAATKFGFVWEDPEEQVKGTLVSEMASIARAHGMQLSVCSQKRFVGSGIRDAKCVDANRLSDVGDTRIRVLRKGNRPECGCDQSRDIGAYDTCPHGCVYCYAVRNKEVAQQHYRKHNPASEYLFG